VAVCQAAFCQHRRLADQIVLLLTKGSFWEKIRAFQPITDLTIHSERIPRSLLRGSSMLFHKECGHVDRKTARILLSLVSYSYL
jgi:hypothetical protein